MMGWQPIESAPQDGNNMTTLIQDIEVTLNRAEELAETAQAVVRKLIGYPPPQPASAVSNAEKASPDGMLVYIEVRARQVRDNTSDAMMELHRLMSYLGIDDAEQFSRQSSIGQTKYT